jgi:hypothetical protein
MNLQEKVNVASAGATLQHDTEFIGNLRINKPLTILGAGVIRTPNADPAVHIPPGTGPVTLRGLEITSDPNWQLVHDLIRWGGEGAEQDSLDKVPVGLAIEACDVHGHPNQPLQRGISANGANLRVIKSKIREVHGNGYDSQAIGAWNGPGPFLIEDSYLEAAGENVMFGGALVTIPNLVPSNITIRRSQFFKPLSWKGSKWTIKNHFELKNARDVLVEDCSFENCWVAAQDGYSWLFTVRGEGQGRNPWNTVESVMMRNCTVKNCFRGIQTLGKDNLDASQQGRGLTISNCRFEQIADWFLVLGGFHDVTIEHVTHQQGHNIVVFTGNRSRNFVYLNNVTERNPNAWGFKADGGGEGTAALDQYCDGWRVQGSVIAGAPSSLYPAGNFFPTDLLTLSSFKGTDGLTPGHTAATAPVVLPVPSPDGTKARTITDTKGALWTIGGTKDTGPTLRDGKQMAGGEGSIYKLVSGIVYVLGTDEWWWKWSAIEANWIRHSQSEPGAAALPKRVIKIAELDNDELLAQIADLEARGYQWEGTVGERLIFRNLQ